MPPQPVNSDTQSKTKPPRPLWEKLLVWGSILGLLILVAVESSAQRGYTTTLTRLEQKIADLESGDPSRQEAANPQETQLDDVARGWYFQKSALGSKSQLITWIWPSLFKRYALQISLTTDGEILEFATDESLIDPTSPNAAAKLSYIDVSPVADGTVVALVPSEPHHVLAREVVRQAFLTTAREQFQLATPDSALLHPSEPASEGDNWPFQFEFNVEPGVEILVQIQRVTPQDREQVFLERVEMSDGQYWKLLPALAARWMNHEFVDVLSAAGYARKPSSADPQPVTPLAQDVQELQSQFNPVSQFAALRALHSQWDAQEPSPAVCSALARGYALLGSLTEMNLSVMHKVFKGRALLWAEHGVQNWPEDPEVWWSRAYVRTLCGLHALALADIDHATQLDSGMPPTWSTALTAYCHWDSKGLEQAAETNPLLANHLQLLMIEQTGTNEQRLQAAQKILQSDPTSWRVNASLAASTTLGIRHLSGAAGIPSLQATVPSLLEQIPDLPASVLTLIEDSQQNNRARVAVRQLFQGVGLDDDSNLIPQLVAELQSIPNDDTKPAPLDWHTLGAIINDTLFQQVISLLDFHRNWLGVETKQTIEQATLLVPDHPLSGLIPCYDTNLDVSRQAVEGINPVLLKTEFSDPAVIVVTLSRYVREMNNIYARIQGQRDDIAPDLIASFKDRGVPYDRQLKLLASMERVDPDCPLIAAFSVQTKWESIEPEAREWEEKYANHPEVMKNLTQGYLNSKRLSDARRAATRWTVISPESASFSMLANICMQQDDWEGQQSSLKEILKLPSLGLEHAQAASALAYGYMDRQQWETAKPFAERAAQSYSAWGLMCAADCYEGLEDWDRAEALMRACSERYDNSRDEWYRWCRRTGRDCPPKALQLYEQMLSEPSNNDENSTRLQQAVIRQLEGDTQHAYDLIVECTKKSDDDYFRMLAAELAFKLGRQDLCNQWLQELANRSIPSAPACMAQAVLRTQRDATLSPTADELEWCAMLDLRDGGPSNGMYCVAQFLKILGDERASEWLRRCAASPRRNKFAVTLAGRELTLSGESSPRRRGQEVDSADAESVKLLREGYLHASRREFQEALKKYRDAANLSPDFPTTQYAIAVTAFDLHQDPSALDAYSQLIAGAPHVPQFYASRGRVYESMNLPALAIADYETGLKADPDSKMLHNNMASLLLSVTDDEFRDVERALKHVPLALGGDEKSRWIELSLQAAAAAATNDFEKAIELQDQAVQLTASTERFRQSRRASDYRKQQPYIRAPATVPLLEFLHPDGSWVSYELLVTTKERPFLEGRSGPLDSTPIDHRAEVTVRSVSTYPQEDRTLRCLEIEIVSDNLLLESKVYRLLVPESAFGAYKHPMRETVKLWVGTRNGPVLPMENLADDPWLQYLLSGPTYDIYRKDELQEVAVPTGTIECQVLTGHSDSKRIGDWYTASWTVLRNSNVPFGLAGGQLEIKEQREIAAKLTLKDFGSITEAAFPDLVP